MHAFIGIHANARAPRNTFTWELRFLYASETADLEYELLYLAPCYKLFYFPPHSRRYL